MPDIKLTASDGHQLDGFRLDPKASPRGGLVVLQEIFGVNDHIRSVVAMYTGLGYACLAPALFDRIEPGVRLGYGDADFGTGLGLAQKLDPEQVILDVNAAIANLAASGVGKIAVIGYCLGGALTWLSAARAEGLSAAISYYGAQIPMFVDARPRVPTLFHLGQRDGYFPIAKAREICSAVEGGEVHEYDADHGFACDHRPPVFDAAATALAFERSIAFLAEQLG
ncbi:dienelactone hydrolase family protein [Pseudenhygromyxa sp. WMMC2535]|uniref:dienelactone hydrolase family protein n=1 Tax=Pseudenhygromyxa sp. WMMC2535 TaxID=2712867 RepID=UPI001551D2BA|nr:dienelactone hydrolase family protein [Pseudenhygromyxa sp. WMMC2535]